MTYGIMLASTTLPDAFLYYAHVPKGYNRWVTNKNDAHQFKTKKEAEDLALKLFNELYTDESKARIVVIDFPA